MRLSHAPYPTARGEGIRGETEKEHRNWSLILLR